MERLIRNKVNQFSMELENMLIDFVKKSGGLVKVNCFLETLQIHITYLSIEDDGLLITTNNPKEKASYSVRIGYFTLDELIEILYAVTR